MADPITIPLGEFQRRLFAQLIEQEKQIQSQRNTAAAAIIAGIMDPASVAGRGVQITDESIVIAPLPDIAPASETLTEQAG